jgi:transposase
MLQMNSKEQLKVDVIGRLDSGKVTAKQAMQILNKSESTIYRYLRNYQEEGVLFVKHKNSFKRPANKIDINIESKIIELCKNKYKDYNRSHAREEIAANEEIEVAKVTFNRICQRNKLLNKRIKRRKPKPRKRRDRMRQYGVMLQLDGSPHKWFGRKQTCLVAVIDDATSDILYGEFSPTETTFACMNVVKWVLKHYGVFQILYTDRAGIFGKDPLNHKDAVKRDGFSALKSCLESFKINTIYAYSPQAKGRIERCFNTLQDRLVVELKSNNIYTAKEATTYLNEVYLPKHRKNFAVEAEDKRSAFVPLIDPSIVDDRFYSKTTRVIKNNHTFQIDGSILDIDMPKECCAGEDIEIRKYPCGKISYYIGEKQVFLRKSVARPY